MRPLFIVPKSAVANPLFVKHPVFPGCDPELSSKKQTDCFSDKMRELFQKHLRVDRSWTGKVFFIFKINTEGKLTDIRFLRNPLGKAGSDEITRVLNLAPKCQPGLDKDGNPVEVQVALPLSF